MIHQVSNLDTIRKSFWEKKLPQVFPLQFTNVLNIDDNNKIDFTIFKLLKIILHNSLTSQTP